MYHMALVLPQEIVVDRFLPTFRSMLADELSNRRFTQSEIADALGVTQPAVSKYISRDIQVEENILDDPATRNAVKRIADKMDSGKHTGYDVLSEVLTLINELEDRGPICEIHEEQMPSLRGLGCDLCVRGFDSDLLVEKEILHELRKATRELEGLDGAEEFIPNVGTNIGYALPEPTDVTDVAAIPGRIYRMRGRIHVPANPEFGASRNVAQAIIAAASYESSIRSAMNLGTDDRLLEAIAETQGEPVEMDAGYDGRREELVEIFDRHGAVPRCIYHRGEFGIEPIMYLFAENPGDLIDSLREALEEL